MSVSKTTPIVGQSDWVSVSRCNTITCDDDNVSSVLANMVPQSSSELRPAPRSARPINGKSGHIRKFLKRQHDRKSREKCNCECEGSGLRTQSGRFPLEKMHGELRFRGPLQTLGTPHGESHDGQHARLPCLNQPTDN